MKVCVTLALRTVTAAAVALWVSACGPFLSTISSTRPMRAAVPDIQPTITEAAALALRPGAELRQAQAVILPAPRHEFTQRDAAQRTYVLVSAQVETQSGPGKWLSFLFQDGRLWKRMDKLPCFSRSSPCNHDVEKLIGGCDPSALASIVIADSANLDDEELKAIMADSEDFVRSMASAPPQIPIPVVCGITCLAFWSVPYEVAIRHKNKHLAARYSGLLVQPGQSERAATEAYGRPVATRRLDSARTIQFYRGDDVGLTFEASYSPVAVVVADNVVAGVYSYALAYYADRALQTGVFPP